MKSMIMISYMLISTIIIIIGLNGGFAFSFLVINYIFIGPILWEKLCTLFDN